MDSSNMKETLLDKVSNFDNLYTAFRECARGKRKSLGYKNFLFAYGEKLKSIEEEIKATCTYRWNGYRDFYVYDPKKRLIMAAPFKDRVVHTAIHRVIEPIIDKELGARSFACRVGMGSRNATIRLYNQLRFMKDKRYCVKLDVQKYFESINHEILLSEIKKFLTDNSLDKILKDLVSSHRPYRIAQKGQPIGNLTSQLFANFYLRSMDYKACSLLGIDFYKDEVIEDNFYIRYMDDSVILTRNKEKALFVANELVSYAKDVLKLNIPNNKKVILANDPVPFLGFVLNDDGYRTLRRNERKFVNKLKRSVKKNEDLSKRAQKIQSYEAWRNLMV